MRTAEIENKIMTDVWESLLGKGWIRLPDDRFILPYQHLSPLTFAELLEHEQLLVLAICNKYLSKEKALN